MAVDPKELLYGLSESERNMVDYYENCFDEQLKLKFNGRPIRLRFNCYNNKVFHELESRYRKWNLELINIDWGVPNEIEFTPVLD
jgi:hypothetical protein